MLKRVKAVCCRRIGDRSKDGDSHLAKLEAVLLKLREAGLKAKLTKCEFLE